MRRRKLFVLGAVALAQPNVLQAQTGRRPLIGYLDAASRESQATRTAAFVRGLAELGYVDGRSIDIAFQFADEGYAQLPSLADTLVRAQPRVIVAAVPPAALALRKATQTIPIVGALLDEPIRMGLIATYARPGGNVTGLVNAVDGLSAKQLEIALDLVPGATTVGLLVDPLSPSNVAQRQEIETAGATRGVKVAAVEVRAKADLDAAFRALTAAGVQVVIVLRDSLLFSERVPIAVWARAARLPTVFAIPEHVEAGGLVSYGVSVTGNFHRAASFVDRILKGGNPAELPVEFPGTLEMVVNLETARVLGFVVPPTLLLRADRVIE